MEAKTAIETVAPLINAQYQAGFAWFSGVLIAVVVLLIVIMLGTIVMIIRSSWKRVDTLVGNSNTCVTNNTMAITMLSEKTGHNEKAFERVEGAVHKLREELMQKPCLAAERERIERAERTDRMRAASEELSHHTAVSSMAAMESKPAGA